MSQQVDRQQKTRPNYHQTSANGLCPERTDGWANCSPINDLNETANGRNEVNCKCDSDPPPVMGGQSVGKSKMNLIYEKLDNFYSTFKLRKKPAVNQRWLNEGIMFVLCTYCKTNFLTIFLMQNNFLTN